MRTVRLGDVAELQAGVGFPLTLQGRSTGDYPFAKVGDISDAGRAGKITLSAATHFIDEGDLNKLRAKPIPPGATLFAKIGEAIRQNHRVRAGCPILIDNNAMAAIPGPNLDGQFLFRYLQSVDFYRLTSSTTVPALRKSELQQLPIPFPPLSEQKRIADILDKADALRTQRRATLARLDELTQSIFLNMFGDPVINPKGWPRWTFDQTIRDETAKSEKLQKSDYLPTGAHPVIDQGQSVVAGYCDDDKFLCKSELPLVVFGDHTRVVKLVKSPFVVGADGAKVLVPQHQVGATYLSFLLEHLPIPDLGYSRHMKEVKRLAFPIPPLALQEEFAARVSHADRHRVKLERALAICDGLFASLQHRAFSGTL